MDTMAMAGSMGLTFFCNKCVEALYKFKGTGIVSDELKKVCMEAMSGLKSLKWPAEGCMVSGEKTALFNTNEEIKTFERALPRGNGGPDKELERLIKNLGVLLEDKPIGKQKKVAAAEQLQRFFDILGDYSFYATRDCLRETDSMAGA